MELFAADRDRLAFLLETDAALDLDFEALLTDNPKAGSFVRDNFKGIFFARGVHALIDTIRANVDRLSGFKKDLALFALGKTCMSGTRVR